MLFKPHPYQAYIAQYVLNHSGAGVFVDMGLGKTSATLTAIVELLRSGEVKKVLIIAPLRVAQDTWSGEIAKWDHLRHLRLSKVLGKESVRKKALLEKADIYIINRENVPWLVAHYASGFPFDMLVVDESSSFKNPKSQRFKSLRQVAPLISRTVILTGTPVPNGLCGLWSQVYLLDRGERLGESYALYLKKYFRPDARSEDHVHSYKLLTPDAADEDILGADIYAREIHDKISDICFSMKAEDYLQLPARIDRISEITMRPATLDKYLQFERDQVLALEDEEAITALSAAALTTKLLQYANGAVYDEDRNIHVVHDEKLDALEEIIESADGQPVLVFYSYQHDLKRMQARLKKYSPRQLKTSADIADWNEGKVQVLLAHPASAGHGLNLQAGGNIIVWFGLPWSLELYEQANARLHRQGQTKPVIIHHLVMKGTIDLDVWDALRIKSGGQNALMRAVKARFDHYRRQIA